MFLAVSFGNKKSELMFNMPLTPGWLALTDAVNTLLPSSYALLVCECGDVIVSSLVRRRNHELVGNGSHASICILNPGFAISDDIFM